MCDAFCGALQRRGIAPPPLLWPPTKTSAKFKFVFHRLDHVHDPIHSMLPPKKVLRCCNAHPAANNQKRNAFFISGFRDTLTQSLKMFLILQTFYEIVGKVKIILRTTYLLFSYPRVAGSNQTGLWVHPSTCSQSIPKSRCYSH